jgi:hypothetical protein
MLVLSQVVLVCLVWVKMVALVFLVQVDKQEAVAVTQQTEHQPRLALVELDVTFLQFTDSLLTQLL